MDTPWWYWTTGFAVLWVFHMGIVWTVLPTLMFCAFALGCFAFLYSNTSSSVDNFERVVFTDMPVKPGLRKVLEEMNSKVLPEKMDARLTGSHTIDTNLNEIISLLMRDFIKPWYQKLSSDDNFLVAVQIGFHDIIVNIAARMKDVGWITYLTTRLVDDAASHLRLYRQASEKTKLDVDAIKVTPQSLASFKSATLQNFPSSHSRSNSDAGVASPKTHSRNSSIGEKVLDLEAMFFQLEAQCETNKLSHDLLCNSKDSELRYLREVLNLILYLVLPGEDFKCQPARTLFGEIIINALVLPLVDKLVDPDFVNMCIIWLCKDAGLTSDAFLAALRSTLNRDELLAILDIVNREIAVLRGRDLGSDSDALRKDLSSLQYVKKSIDLKLQGNFKIDKLTSASKLVILPLSEILKNNIAMSYFIDFLATVDMQHYIFLHLSIESWRSSFRSEIRIGQPRIKVSESLKENAMGIYNQYFSEHAPRRVRLDGDVEETLIIRMREPLSENLFDEVISGILAKLQSKTLSEFYKSSVYLKLLTELDLLKEIDPEDDLQSPDNVSLSDSYDEEVSKPSEPTSGSGKYQINVEIVDCGIVQDRGKTYGLYALSVERTFENGFVERWHVYRRYSDFHDLQQKVKDSYADLGRLPFPGKKTFNNMEATTLAKRMKMLNNYLQILLHSGVAETHHKLPAFLLSFLEPGEYDKSASLGSAIESVVSPIKRMGAVVRTMPDNLFNSVDSLSRPGRKDPGRAAAEILSRNEENIPLRIMLLLMDEIFDLQSRNQWLRRRIMALLRQMFGDIVNRKILDFVEELTSPEQVASYLLSLKESLWPDGIRVDSYPDRDDATRQRTRIAAKTALLSFLSDDLKHILGSETTRKGLLRVYDTFQHSRLNRRLVYVLLEGVLELIFPPISALHSKISARRDKALLKT